MYLIMFNVCMCVFIGLKIDYQDYNKKQIYIYLHFENLRLSKSRLKNKFFV